MAVREARAVTERPQEENRLIHTKRGPVSMEDNKKSQVALISTKRIKRLPCLMFSAPGKEVNKHKQLANERGYRLPVVVSDTAGCMTLLSGTAAFEASLEDNASEIPAVIVRVDNEADGLMFALRTADLDGSLGAVAVSDAIIRLIDVYNIPRKRIAQTLSKSPAWIARMENLGRRLTGTVKQMVAEGWVAPRTAQEIARLPEQAQTEFAVSIRDEFLSKENVSYLVNRYLNEDTGEEERARIISAPRQALPISAKRQRKSGADTSPGARLAHAAALCFDGAVYLKRVLDRADIGEAAVRMPDILALYSELETLCGRLREIFVLGQNADNAVYANSTLQ